MRWHSGEDGAILPCCGLHELLPLFFIIPDLEKMVNVWLLLWREGERGREERVRKEMGSSGRMLTSTGWKVLEILIGKSLETRHRCPSYFHGSQIKRFTIFKATWHINEARKSALFHIKKQASPTHCALPNPRAASMRLFAGPTRLTPTPTSPSQSREAHDWGLIDEVIEHRPVLLVSDAVSSDQPNQDGGGGGANKGTEEPSPAWLMVTRCNDLLAFM
jgi:hypothetical protein